MAPDKHAAELMTAKLFFNAAFPVTQTMLEDDPAMARRFKDVTATVQVRAKERDGFIGCRFDFDRGSLTVSEGLAEKADLTLTFSSVEKMNTMFRGGFALPSIKGWGKPALLIKTLLLLMSLMLMQPSNRPKDPARQALKVKMSLYMITRALSVYNKAGDPDMRRWTEKQPNRVYQFIVDNADIACYLRVKAGNTKSGHGIYERRRPFVLFRFFSVEGALKVLLKEVAFVEGVEKGCVEIVGSPEYASQVNDFMAVLQGMMT
jgi:hypothetical protein